MTGVQLASYDVEEKQYYARLFCDNLLHPKSARYELRIYDRKQHIPPKLRGLIPGHDKSTKHNITNHIRIKGNGQAPRSLDLIIDESKKPPTAKVEITYDDNHKSIKEGLELP